MKLRIWPFVALLTAFALGWISSCHHARKAREGANPPLIDTVTVLKVDTVLIKEPQPYAVTVVDTLLVAVTDTLRIHDTTFVQLPREQKLYRDSTYIAWVSGYRPALDSINVYQRDIYHTITVREKAPTKRWGLGIHAGYGVMPADNKIYAAPYVGVGLSYNILNF